MNKYLFLVICAIVLATEFVIWRSHNAERAQAGKGIKHAGSVNKAMSSQNTPRAHISKNNEHTGNGDPKTNTADTIIWGAPTKGFALAVIPSQREYTLGQDIAATVRFKNVSNTTVGFGLDVTDKAFFREYRAVLYTADGRPVAKSKKYIDLEATLDPSRPEPVDNAVGKVQLAPEEEYTVSFKVNDWFTIEKEGTYSLLVMRGISGWNYGIAISNLTTFKVIKGKGDAAKPKE